MNEVNLGNILIPAIVPQRGVDYWTEEDKQEIVNDAINSVDNIVVPQENVRQSNELSRIANENTRQSNEAIRQSNEGTRQTNETTRQANETTRQSNENTRQTNETNRTNTFNTQMNNVQTAIQGINTSQTSFNANAEAKTILFNDNATSKTTDFNTNATNKTTAFNENAAAKTTEFDEHAADVEEQLDLDNSDLRNAMLQVTGQGTNITLNGTSKNKFTKLVIKGKTEQDLLTGKNKIDEPKATWDNYLTTNTINSDDSITVASTSANKYAAASKIVYACEQGKTYTISLKAISVATANPNIRLGKNNSAVGNIIGYGESILVNGVYKITKTFTADENFDLLVSLYPKYDTDAIGSAKFYDFQVELGSTATAYEPYCRTEFQALIQTIRRLYIMLVGS